MVWCNICVHSKAFQPLSRAKSHCMWFLGCLSLWVYLIYVLGKQIRRQNYRDRVFSKRFGILGTY